MGLWGRGEEIDSNDIMIPDYETLNRPVTFNNVMDYRVIARLGRGVRRTLIHQNRR